MAMKLTLAKKREIVRRLMDGEPIYLLALYIRPKGRIPDLVGLKADIEQVIRDFMNGKFVR